MNAGVTGEKMNSRCTVNAVVGPLPAARLKQKAIHLSVNAKGRKVRSVGRHRLDKEIVLLDHRVTRSDAARPTVKINAMR
jgi:hypothetical protein